MSAIKLPLFLFRFTRNMWRYDGGWFLTLILAPFPAEEQIPGAWIKALINMRIDFNPRWPFIEVDAYTPRRDLPRRDSTE